MVTPVELRLFHVLEHGRDYRRRDLARLAMGLLKAIDNSKCAHRTRAAARREVLEAMNCARRSPQEGRPPTQVNAKFQTPTPKFELGV